MTCRVCQEDKAEDEFAYKVRETGRRHTICRPCSKLYSARHYRANAAAYKKRGVVNGIRRRGELQVLLLQYLLSHPCVDCGEADPVVLDFDHRDAADKQHTVSRMWNIGFAWKKIMVEIAKCDVRCANCHRRRTAKQFGWSILNLLKLESRATLAQE